MKTKVGDQKIEVYSDSELTIPLGLSLEAGSDVEFERITNRKGDFVGRISLQNRRFGFVDPTLCEGKRDHSKAERFDPHVGRIGRRTLRSWRSPKLKVPIRRVTSPLKTERAVTKRLREGKGKCCLCGLVLDGKGLDLYAGVHFCFEHQVEATISGAKYYNTFTRFLGWWELLYCPNCLPESAIRESHKRLVHVMIASGSIFVVCSLLVLGMLMSGYSSVFAAMSLIAVGLISLCISLAKLPRTVSYLSFEEHYFYQEVRRFVAKNRQDLISACDLTGNVVFYGGSHQPTDQDITFYIEPSAESEEVSDEKGGRWLRMGRQL